MAKRTKAKGKQGPKGPILLDEKLIAQIERSLFQGNFVTVVCRQFGISRESFYHWLKLGETQETGLYRKLSDTVKIAQANAEVNDLEMINAAALGGAWQAAAWKLERKYPKRWSQKIKTTISEEFDEGIRKLQKQLPTEIFVQVLSVLGGPSESLAVGNPGGEAEEGGELLPSPTEPETK